MRKFSTVLIGAASVAALFAITACKELFANIEEDFSYWASEPVITGFTAASSAQTSPAGVQCVPSATDAVITLTVRNPKNFSFVMPGTGAPADIVRFASGIHDASGTKAPEAGTDYTLSQSGQSTLTLTYKPAFLKRYEQSRANIGASITLYSTDGRKFNQTYSFDLEANTPPPDPAPVEASTANKIALFKTRTPEDGKHYYVLCFKVGSLPGENVLSGVPLHSDLTYVYVSKNGGAETAYPVTLNSGDFVITNPLNTAFIAKTAVTELLPAEADALSGSPQPDTVPLGPWVLYLKTDVPVGGATAKYGIRLFDRKFYSARAEQSIGKRELPAPKVFADSTMNTTADSGVYTEKGATNASGNNDLNGEGATIGGVLPDGSNETHAIPVYSAYGGAVKLTIKKPDGTDYPTGVTVTGSAEQDSGDSVSGTASFTGGQSASVTLPSPTNGGGVAVYKVVFKASGEGFDDSNERTLYYKVRREVKAVNGTLPMWHILKEAIAYTSADGTVVVNGEIKATNASGNYDEITIDKNLTIRGNNKTSDILNANTTDGSKPGHRIFSVNSGTLTLKNLTLKGGICPSGAGGGIYIKNNGSSCKMADTDIKNCTVSGGNKLGGAVYVRINGSLTVESGCVISGNTAPYGKGAAVYLESGGTFNIAGDAQIDEANDVFLEKHGTLPYVPSKNAKLTVAAPLTGTHIVARITPEDYTAGVTAVNAASGVDISAYANRFKITDQNPMTPWKLIHNGTDLILKQATTVIPSGSNAWKTLKEAIEASSVEDGDEFLVQGAITATSATDNYGAISVTKKITVKGTGSTPVLNANSSGTNRPPTPHRIFTVEDGGELTLENLTLKNGKAASSGEGAQGGGILVKAGCKAELKNCIIKNCEANAEGGGIYSAGELVLDGSTIGGASAFDGNKAKNGGGICLKGSTGMTLKDCIIKNNEVTDGEGGGICFDSGSYGSSEYTITGGEISYNKIKMTDSILTRSGGGLAIANMQIKVVIDSCTIEGNTIEGVSGRNPRGAGLWLGNDAQTTIKGASRIKDNKLHETGNPNSFIGTGGGIQIEGGKLTVQGGTVISGNGAKDGGGIYAQNNTTLNAEITLTNTKINSCVAEENGGGLYIKDSKLTLDNAIIGGDQLYSGTQAGVTKGNKAKYGGGIFLTGSDAACTMTGGKISYNEARRTDSERPDGGGIYIEQSASFTMKGGEISNNKSENSNSIVAYGGGVYVKGQAGGTSASFTLENGTIKNNTAYFGGGVVLNNGGIFNMQGGTIEGNHATNDGGGVGVQGIMKMTGGTISGNTASGKGKGVYVSTSQRVMEMSGSAKIDTDNDVYLDGMASSNAKITVDGSLSNNPAARITVPNGKYQTTTKVLDGSAVGSEHAKFAVTPKGDEYWTVGSDGCLTKNKTDIFNNITKNQIKAAIEAADPSMIYSVSNIIYDRTILNGKLILYKTNKSDNYGIMYVTEVDNTSNSGKGHIKFNYKTFRYFEGDVQKENDIKVTGGAKFNLDNGGDAGRVTFYLENTASQKRFKPLDNAKFYILSN